MRIFEFFVLGAPKVEYYPADMSKPDEINAMMQSISKDFGKLDILVNNAGIQQVAPIDDFDSEKWELIVRVNLVSAFYTIKNALPLMKSNKWGRIVNIASLHGLVASPYKVLCTFKAIFKSRKIFSRVITFRAYFKKLNTKQE